MKERAKWIKEILGACIADWVPEMIAECWEKEIVSQQERIKALDAQLAEAKRSASRWEEDAKRYCQNAAYWREKYQVLAGGGE